jgi:class 3 adenylate cyclase/tetratricopeptide (TPR) repeat protein
MALCAACGVDNAEDARFCKGCGAQLAPRIESREQRKTVTAVFCDVVDSTALGESRDPEALKVVLGRYFERMQALVETHGGTVQKFIGDAVVAVFGVPVVHEDDAVRALQAAAAMRAALPELGLEARIRVNTGEVVTGGFGTLVLGDAVNVAARLQQAAGPGEILVGAGTLALAGDAATVEELVPLELRGKSEPVPAFRLVAVQEPAERQHRSHFVGRESELALLREAWRSAVGDGCCEFVTIVGEAGVGKSRLAAELVDGLGVRVVRGHCLSYGEGITYFPVSEVIGQLDAVSLDPAAAAAIRSLLGESDAGTSPDQIAWAFRQVLEGAAREQPLLVVFDDIQWGEETFLDLVEQLALLSTGAPLLLLCLARPELLERRPRWRVALELAPLPSTDAEELLPVDVPASLRDRIARAAGGNPLFLTEMAAMAAVAGDEVVVPPTLKSLLAARLDQLEEDERNVLERGAVEGEMFHRGAVQALSPDEPQVSPRLAALVRKELIRPDQPLLPAEDGFRFCHLLVRDAAYDALPKAARAELHARFADWLDEHGGSLVEGDEIVGYHLQQAYRYHGELGTSNAETERLGERAAARLAAAGRRAAIRGDYHAVVNLFERALALGVTDQHERVRVEVDLGKALYETGRIEESEVLLDATRDAATSLGERGVAARALVQILGQRLSSDPAVGAVETLPAAEEAMRTFEVLGDSLGLAEAGRLLSEAYSRAGRTEETFAALERALADAQAAGSTGMRRQISVRLAEKLCLGPTPLSEAIPRLEQLLASSRDDRVLEASLIRYLGYALAMAGRFEEAERHLQASSRVLDEADETSMSWSLSRWSIAGAKQLLGDEAGAEQDLIALWRHFRDLRGDHPEARAMRAAAALALLCCDQGRWEEAAGYLAYGREVDESPPADGKIYAYLRLAARARVAAHDGDLHGALELARQAVEVAESHDGLSFQAGVWLALAEVQTASGLTADAGASRERALELYAQKGNVAAVAALVAASP